MNEKQVLNGLLIIVLPLLPVLAFASLHGLNCPPQQGTSGAGCFIPGVYNYTYTVQNMIDSTWHGVEALRIPVNLDTANNPDSLLLIESYFSAVNYQGIICMFNTQYDQAAGGHGNGYMDDVNAYAQAWKNIHAVFGKYPNIKYELYNEPHGYGTDVNWYMNDMQTCINTAGMPVAKVILSALSWGSDIDLIKNVWEGDIAYHYYSWWLPEGNRTRENFKARLLDVLAGLEHRIHITEFGANLDLGDVYNSSNRVDGDVEFLIGMQEAIAELTSQGKILKGLYHWHGWHNGDRYDFWDDANSFGKQKIQQIWDTAAAPAPDPVLMGDVNSDDAVNIVDALMTAQYCVGLNPSGFNPANADVNCDGSINIVDALMIARYYVGLQVLCSIYSEKRVL